MTNELEKNFFDTFGIEPKYAYLVTDMFYTSNSHNYEATKNDLIKYFGNKNCGRYKVTEVYKTYPQITDRILLELICICNSTYINGYTNYFMATGKTKEGLKEEILKKCIALSKDIKCQVRTLFKEK